MHKKLLIVTMATLVAFGLTGCVKTPKLENGQEVIAELNGKNITANDLYDELRGKYGVDTLLSLVDDYIVSQELKDTSSEEAEAKAYIKQMKDYYTNAGQDWNQVLASNNITEDELTKMYTTSYAKETIAKNYYKETVTEDEINKYYEDEIIGDITAKHILITVDVAETATDEEKSKAEKEAYNKALEVIKKLDNKEDFAALAKEYSKDKSSSEGGSLAPFNKQSNYAKEFIDAAVKLNAGEYTKTPVKSQYGYHIILVESKAEKPALDTVKTNIIDTLATQKMSENSNYTNTAWKKLREKYNLKLNDTVIEEKYNTAMSQY